jgi:multidrug efflux pump subunit AcrA (membrane-fusion protein)
MILLTAALSGCVRQQQEAASIELLETARVRMDTVQVITGDIANVECADAYIHAYTEGLSFEIGGTVSAVYVYPGKWVEEGEILAEIDQRNLQQRIDALREEIEYEQQNSEYSDALAELEIERLEVELRQLQAQRSDSAQIELKRNEIAAAQAQLRQTRQLRTPKLQRKIEQLEQLEAQQGKNVLRAPFAGRVSAMGTIYEGVQIRAHEKVIFIADESRIMLEGSALSQEALLRAERLYVRIGRNEYEVKADGLTQSGKQTVQYVFADGQIPEVRIGEYAVVCAVCDAQKNALLIPINALHCDADGYFVYAEENGQRVRRGVQIGVGNDAFVQITEGIGEGAVVYVGN